MRQFAKPGLPLGLLHAMTLITPGGAIDAENGGQWRPALHPSHLSFQGIVMPLSNEDLEYLPEGTYTRESCKLYTNGQRVAVGARFTDTYDGATYTVKTELTHGPLHPMKRYLVERKGEASPK